MDLMSFTPTAPVPFGNVSREAQVAYDHRAPDDEVSQAGAELMASLAGAIEVNPEAQVAWADYRRLQEAEKTGDRLLMKALSYSHPEAAQAKARTEAVWSILGGGGLYIQKPGLTFDALRAMRQRVEVAASIHATRKRQVKRFGQPSEKDDKPGFRIKHCDAEHKPSEDEIQYMHWLTEFITHGGRDFRPWMRRRMGRRTLQTFLGEFTDESLTHDNVAIETVPLAGVPGLDSYYLRDGGTFYLAAPNPNGIYAYQSLVGLPEMMFSYEQLALFQRNLSPYVEARGYGRSELESAVSSMSSLMTAMDYTQTGMDNNAIPRGILTVYGQFDRTQMAQFQAAWQAKIRGVNNRFGMPVLFSRNGQAAAQFTSTGQDFDEMAFVKWISLQVSVMSGLYGVDPKEIHFDGFSSGTSSPLSGDDTAEKLATARDTGLDPFLADTEGFLSDELIARFDPRYRLIFTGLETMEAKAKREREEKVSTINELRASLGMKPHPLGWFGELPADPGLLSAEFQRLSLTMTFDEGRRVWGGFDAYPDAALGAAPLAAQLGALYSQALAPAPDPNAMPGGPGADGNPFAGGPGEDGEEGEGDDGEGQGGQPLEGEVEDGAPNVQQLQTRNRLQQMKEVG
jgi:hypothetical protein